MSPRTLLSPHYQTWFSSLGATMGLTNRLSKINIFRYNNPSIWFQRSGVKIRHSLNTTIDTTHIKIRKAV